MKCLRGECYDFSMANLQVSEGSSTDKSLSNSIDTITFKFSSDNEKGSASVKNKARSVSLAVQAKDHNTYLIVKFPDLDPSLDSISVVGREYRTLNLPMPHRTRRFILLQTDSSLPEALLWYPTGEVVTASCLFLDSRKQPYL
ncbi:hypothetical protein Droror1_Dr00002221 [Drosera rotundifolia]